jgi:hypothetical protein
MIDTYSKATGRAAKAAQTALQLADDIKRAAQHLTADDVEKRLRLTSYLAGQPAREQQLQHVSDLLRSAMHLMEKEVSEPHERAIVSKALGSLSQPPAHLPISLELVRLQKRPNTFATCVAEINVLCSMLEHGNREAQALFDAIAPAPDWRASSRL